MEGNAMFALTISIIAGLSTLLGTGLLFFSKGKNEKLLTIALGFTAGVMISISLTDFYQSAYKAFTSFFKDHLPYGILSVVGFLVLGLLIAGGIDHFVPHQEYDKTVGENPHRNLYRVGFISMLAIGLHNLPEGIASFMSGYINADLGLTVGIAIAIHNIPEGFSVATPIYYATGSKRKAFFATLLSGITEPIGALITFLFLRPFINDVLLGAIFAMVAGIMLYIAIEELIPSSRQYGHNRIALISTFVGILVPPLLHILNV